MLEFGKSIPNLTQSHDLVNHSSYLPKPPYVHMPPTPPQPHQWAIAATFQPQAPSALAPPTLDGSSGNRAGWFAMATLRITIVKIATIEDLRVSTGCMELLDLAEDGSCRFTVLPCP